MDRSEAFGWKFDAGIAAVCLVVAVALYVLFFVLPVNPIYSPGWKLLFSYVGVSVATACLVFIDSATRGTRLRVGNFPEFTDAHWFLIVLFAWPIGLPLYFLARIATGDVLLARVACGATAGAVLIMLLAGGVIAARSHSIYSAGRATNAKITVNGQPVSLRKGLFGKNSTVVITSGTQVQ